MKKNVKNYKRPLNAPPCEITKGIRDEKRNITIRYDKNGELIEDTYNTYSGKRILLFPGENYEFNEKMIHYNVFGFSKENIVAKKCSLINISNFI